MYNQNVRWWHIDDISVRKALYKVLANSSYTRMDIGTEYIECVNKLINGHIMVKIKEDVQCY